MNGFVTYSEGVNDDVNKFVWSALGWRSNADATDTLREYARYFAAGDGFHADEFARGIASLEENWNGPLARNIGVDDTLRQFQQMQKAASESQAANWRFEFALYRAYTDAYERRRLLDANARQARALAQLATAPQVGSAAAIASAETALSADPADAATLRSLREQIEDLAERLFRDIGLQLSVKKFGASAVDRGASLDLAEVSLNDRVWLQQQFAKIRAMQDEAARLQSIQFIVHWRDPGPGGFYDDLGDPASEPHLIRGPGFPLDPLFFRSAHDGIADRTPDQGWRMSQISYAGALYDHPLELRYSGLNPAAQYKLRVVYAGEDYTVPTTLIADGKFVIHGPRLRTANPETVEFALPAEATHTGALDLEWTRPKGLGGGGRGLQIAEVWLFPQAGK
jgi:hypothetical protein